MAKDTVQSITPKGTLMWVTIHGEGKENMSGKMQYVASVILDPKNVPSHKAYIDSIDDFWDENKPSFMGKRKPKSIGYYLCDPLREENGDIKKDDEDKTIYDPEGRVMVTFKTGTSFPDGSAKKIRIFNAKAKEVSLGELRIGNESIGSISGQMGIYQVQDTKKKPIDAGVSLYLNAIQIFKLVEFSADAGFEASDEENEDESWTGDEGFEGVETSSQQEDKPTTKVGPRL